MFWDVISYVLGCDVMFWNVCNVVFWDVMSCSGMLCYVLGCDVMFWDVMLCSGMLCHVGWGEIVPPTSGSSSHSV